MSTFSKATPRILCSTYSSTLDCNIEVSLLDPANPFNDRDRSADLIGLGATFTTHSIERHEIATILIRINHELALKAIKSGSLMSELESMYISTLEELLKEARDEHHVQ